MAFSDKTVEIDFNKIFSNISDYFKNLKGFQQYSWIAIILGILLIIISFII